MCSRAIVVATVLTSRLTLAFFCMIKRALEQTDQNWGRSQTIGPSFASNIAVIVVLVVVVVSHDIAILLNATLRIYWIKTECFDRSGRRTDRCEKIKEEEKTMTRMSLLRFTMRRDRQGVRPCSGQPVRSSRTYFPLCDHCVYRNSVCSQRGLVTHLVSETADLLFILIDRANSKLPLPIPIDQQTVNAWSTLFFPGERLPFFFRWLSAPRLTCRPRRLTTGLQVMPDLTSSSVVLFPYSYNLWDRSPSR